MDEIRPGDEAEPGAAVIRTRGGHDVPVSRRHLAQVRERLGI